MNQIYVGITDEKWLLSLKGDYCQNKLTENVNFWTPGTKKFTVLNPGELFLFKRHNRKSTNEDGSIVGGGYFSHYEQLSILESWEKYERGNGRKTFQEFQDALKDIQRKNNLNSSMKIGCIILEKVFFLEKPIHEPKDWHKNIVSGKNIHLIQN